jgi:hypothetical protein
VLGEKSAKDLATNLAVLMGIKRNLFCSINVVANNPKFYPLKFYRYIVVRNV